MDSVGSPLKLLVTASFMPISRYLDGHALCNARRKWQHHSILVFIIIAAAAVMGGPGGLWSACQTVCSGFWDLFDADETRTSIKTATKTYLRLLFSFRTSNRTAISPFAG